MVNQENSKYYTVEKFQVIESEYDLKNKSESICIITYNDQLMFTYDENINSIGYALKELDKSIPNIFVYTDIKKFNNPITIIQGLKDKDLIRSILRKLKKNIGTGGTYKNGIIILQGNHQEYVKKYLMANDIMKEKKNTN
jgi:translation initiation factor 1